MVAPTCALFWPISTKLPPASTLVVTTFLVTTSRSAIESLLVFCLLLRACLFPWARAVPGNNKLNRSELRSYFTACITFVIHLIHPTTVIFFHVWHTEQRAFWTNRMSRVQQTEHSYSFQICNVIANTRSRCSRNVCKQQASPWAGMAPPLVLLCLRPHSQVDAGLRYSRLNPGRNYRPCPNVGEGGN